MNSQQNAAILLVYSDVIHRAFALGFRDVFNQQLGTRDDLPWTEWKFEMLAHAGLSAGATADAAAAPMLVISTDSGGLPGYIKAWLEAACAKKPGGPASLVILLSNGGLNPIPDCPDRDFLETQAARAARRLLIYIDATHLPHRRPIPACQPRAKLAAFECAASTI